MSYSLEKTRHYPSYNHSVRGSTEHAELIHRRLCKLCLYDEHLAEQGEPGFIEDVKEFFMRRHSYNDIEEMIGYKEEPKEIRKPRKLSKKQRDAGELDYTVEIVTEKIPVIASACIRRHAIFYGWDKERANNIEQVLDTLIDIGFDSAQFKGKIDERTLIHAIDMKNKMSGNYYKPGKNPRDLREQMKATVKQILQRHRLAGQRDVTADMVIQSLARRPGFKHIAALLKDERWEE